MRTLAIPATAILFLGFAQSILAAEDPTGTWTFTAMFGKNKSAEVTLKLKLDGDKLTGAMSGDRAKAAKRPSLTAPSRTTR